MSRIDELCGRVKNYNPLLNPFALLKKHVNAKPENYHSKVIAELLDPKNYKDEPNKSLLSFISLLKEKSEERGFTEVIEKLEYIRGRISDPSYQNCIVVECEKDRMDVSIRDQKNGWAIFIENKICGAPDMPRQVPRYIEKLARDYKHIVAVYLKRNDGDGFPAEIKWKANDENLVKRCLVPLSACQKDDQFSLVLGWLKKMDKSDAVQQYADYIASDDTEDLMAIFECFWAMETRERKEFREDEPVIYERMVRVVSDYILSCETECFRGNVFYRNEVPAFNDFWIIISEKIKVEFGLDVKLNNFENIVVQFFVRSVKGLSKNEKGEKSEIIRRTYKAVGPILERSGFVRENERPDARFCLRIEFKECDCLNAEFRKVFFEKFEKLLKQIDKEMCAIKTACHKLKI